jgi:hypothetical protein
MFGFSGKLPVTEEQRLWTNMGFERLAQMLGQEKLLEATTILPDDKFFPDRYDGSHDGVIAMAERVARYMGIARNSFVVEIYAENEQAWRELIPVWSGETTDAAGFYFHEPHDGRYLVGVHGDQLEDPLCLVATLAHELAHVLLLGGGLLDRNQEDMEPLTDLATVFLGMGFFTASAAFQFRQWTDNSRQGWSTKRTGYLSEQLWGYALAYFTYKRSEDKPTWAGMLPRNIRAYFKQSSAWLRKHPNGQLE